MDSCWRPEGGGGHCETLNSEGLPRKFDSRHVNLIRDLKSCLDIFKLLVTYVVTTHTKNILQNNYNAFLFLRNPHVGLCHRGMTRPRVEDGGNVLQNNKVR
jgi:hypothetical protein